MFFSLPCFPFPVSLFFDPIVIVSPENSLVVPYLYSSFVHLESASTARRNDPSTSSALVPDKTACGHHAAKNHSVAPEDVVASIGVPLLAKENSRVMSRQVCPLK